MKSLVFPAFLFTSVVWAQASNPAPPAAPQTGPDRVVASFDNDRNITVGQLEAFMNMLPEQMQRSALKDRKSFVQQFALMTRLAEMAESQKLDQKSPTKENLLYNRMYLLMNAELHETMNGITLPSTETQAYYDRNKDRFSQVKVKAIYVTFSANGAADSGSGKPHRTEAEAQEKIEKLRTALVGGADFVKMVKENSEDQTSAGKDGDFGTIKRNDNLPDAIRHAIFELKQGEVSLPVKQPNGFYLFRAEAVSAQPFSEVQDEIIKELKQVRFKAWMDGIVQSLDLKYKDEAPAAPAAAPAPKP